MAWVGELRDLPAHVVVECVTASALNAAIRAQVGAGDTNVERERLRVAEGAPANAGTDFVHAARGLLALYKLDSVETHTWAAIQAAVAKGDSVLIRGEYCSMPAADRFQTACAFSHCLLIIPSTKVGYGFVIDPLDTRNANRPLGRDLPWATIKAFCDSDKDDALIVRGPLPKPTPPPPPPVPPVGDTTMIATVGGLQTAAVLPSTVYSHEPGGPKVGQTPPTATRYLIVARDATNKYAALDGLWGGKPTGVLTLCGWVPVTALTALANAIPPVAPAPPPVAQRTVVGVDVHLSDGTSATLK